MLTAFTVQSAMNSPNARRGTTATETRAAKRRRKNTPQGKKASLDYRKPVLSPDEILERIRSKGLLIKDDEAVFRAIKSIGFFRLLIYMRNFQEQSDTGKRFRGGTSFEDVISLYEFDRKIRLLTLDAIERLEVALRASLSNALITETRDAHWYMKPEHYRCESDFKDRKDKIQKSAGPQYIDGSHGIALQHYYNTYKAPELPPIWLACEKLSLGALSNFLSSLSTKNRKHVLRHLWQGYPEDLLCSWFQSLTDLRNVCAHQDRVWNTSFTVNTPKTHKKHPKDFAGTRFYSRAAVIQLLLRPLGNHAFWKEGLQALLKEHPHVKPNTHLGFPDHWQERPLWKEDGPA